MCTGLLSTRKTGEVCCVASVTTIVNKTQGLTTQNVTSSNVEKTFFFDSEYFLSLLFSDNEIQLSKLCFKLFWIIKIIKAYTVGSEIFRALALILAISYRFYYQLL